MRRALFLAVSAALLPGTIAAVDTDRSASTVASDGRQTWIVSFDEPPIASFRGDRGSAAEKALGLRATSPAITGTARLDMASPAVVAYRQHLAGKRGDRLAAASAKLGRTLEPAFSYDVVNNAVALALTADEAAALAKLPGVQSVEPEAVQWLHTDAGPGWIHADDVWAATDGLGNRGEGMVLGLIDSGINLTHPAFAAVSALDGYTHVNPRGQQYGLCTTGAATCNDKLIGVYDYTMCTGQHAGQGCENQEADTGTDVSGHGSHVGGTVVGNPLTMTLSLPGGPQSVRISGVAPRANVISYKACEKRDTGSTCRGSWTLAAVNQAVADGVDVINYSIGGGPRNPWTDSGSTAMLSARDAGVLVVSSAGNDGPGAGTVGSPANAPWVFAIAASTHDRAIGNRLLDLSGGASAPPSGGVLIGNAQTTGYGPADIVVPNDFPGCGVGEDNSTSPSGASNPWTVGRFAGEIVVCERGTQARVAKSKNVQLAGGGGMVLTNTAADGESTVSDAHSIPSTHLGFSAGQSLRNWLASGTGHRGRIEGTRLVYDDVLGDLIANFSSRGPVAAGNFMKPAVAAPGVSVLAASGTGTGARMLSGTSMASPHVAGAFLLLQKAHPEWSPTDIESALITTAQPNVRASASGAPLDMFQQGAGRIDVARALNAGLSFPVARTDFVAINPVAGGDSRGLNQPALVDFDCFERCSFTRRVKDIAGGGRWRAEVQSPDGLTISVSPQEFTLAAGATLTMRFEAAFGPAADIGTLNEASIILRRVDGSAAAVTPARIPVAVYASPGALPDALVVDATSDRGFTDVALDGLVALEDLRVSASPLSVPTLSQPSLPVDPTPNDRYDNIGVGSAVQRVTVPAGTSEYRLVSTTRSDTSRDVDLMVGIDLDGDGAPDAGEELCLSGNIDANERCELAISAGSEAQTVWVLAQNYAAGTTGGQDVVVVESVLYDLTSPADGSLTVSAPATLERITPFDLRVSWNDPGMLAGDVRHGLVRLSVGDRAPFAELPVKLTRAGTARAPRALVPTLALPLTLPAGAAHEGLYIDVPANASALRISSGTAGSIDLYAARATAGDGPIVAAAPARGQAAATALGGSGDKTLRISGSQLEAGRWYVTPVNTGSAATDLVLTVDLEYDAAAVPMTPGAYFNEQRSGAGGFIYKVGGVWAYLWYTYLQDGSPAWYLGTAAAPTGQQSVWRVPLNRFVWTGSQALPTEVGEAVLTFTATDTFQFSWTVDGEHGSEKYVRIDTGSCALQAGSPLNATGVWYSPALNGFGYSINTGTAVESIAAYAYDAQGNPRWLFGGAAFGSAQFEMSMFAGACPLCSYTPPTTVPVGTFRRTYANDGHGTVRFEYDLAAPLSGSRLINLPFERQTDALGCE